MSAYSVFSLLFSSKLYLVGILSLSRLVWLNWGNANTKAVCNVQRPATSSGGEVAVVFKQFY